MSNHVENKNESGGIAQFFVEHREVSWLALIAVLVWGAVALFSESESPSVTMNKPTGDPPSSYSGAGSSKNVPLVPVLQPEASSDRVPDPSGVRSLVLPRPGNTSTPPLVIKRQ